MGATDTVTATPTDQAMAPLATAMVVEATEEVVLVTAVEIRCLTWVPISKRSIGVNNHLMT